MSVKDQRSWIALRNGQCDGATFTLSAKPCILQSTQARVATLESNNGWKAVAAGSTNTPNVQAPVNAQTSSPINRTGSFPLESCRGWDGTITSLSGVNSSSALMRGVVTKEDLQE